MCCGWPAAGMGFDLRGCGKAENWHLNLCQRLGGLKETKINLKCGKSPKPRNWGGAGLGPLTIHGITKGCSPIPSGSSLVSQAVTQRVPSPQPQGCLSQGRHGPVQVDLLQELPWTPCSPCPSSDVHGIDGQCQDKGGGDHATLENVAFPLFPHYFFFFLSLFSWSFSPFS